MWVAWSTSNCCFLTALRKQETPWGRFKELILVDLSRCEGCPWHAKTAQWGHHHWAAQEASWWSPTVLVRRYLFCALDRTVNFSCWINQWIYVLGQTNLLCLSLKNIWCNVIASWHIVFSYSDLIWQLRIFLHIEQCECSKLYTILIHTHTMWAIPILNRGSSKLMWSSCAPVHSSSCASVLGQRYAAENW